MAPRVSAQQWRGIQRAHKGCQEMSKDSNRQQNDSGFDLSFTSVMSMSRCVRNKRKLPIAMECVPWQEPVLRGT